MSKLIKKFPAYFSHFQLPEGAKEEAIVVYRACKTQKADKESFLPTFEENNFVHSPGDDPNEPGIYSLSTYEKPKEVRRFAATNSAFQPPYKIAIGSTEPICGKSQRTKDRKKKYRGSHVDWWLYEDAEPYSYFKIIEDFELYMKEYKQSKEG